MQDEISVRVYGSPSLPTLIYLPGVQGDWTLAPAIRRELVPEVCWVELTYPRTTDWTLDDYAVQTDRALRQSGIRRGWLLGESFGSQVAWAFLRLESTKANEFDVRGIIIAGGFVCHPFPRGVDLAVRICDNAKSSTLGILLRLWKIWAELRAAGDPVRRQSIRDFMARRNGQDRRALVHRLRLIAQADLRNVAMSSLVPIYSITGFWDPVVFWRPVQRWLRQNCKNYRSGRIVWLGDHTVLFSKPKASARILLNFIEGGG